MSKLKDSLKAQPTFGVPAGVDLGKLPGVCVIFGSVRKDFALKFNINGGNRPDLIVAWLYTFYN